MAKGNKDSVRGREAGANSSCSIPRQLQVRIYRGRVAHARAVDFQRDYLVVGSGRSKNVKTRKIVGGEIVFDRISRYRESRDARTFLYFCELEFFVFFHEKSRNWDRHCGTDRPTARIYVKKRREDAHVDARARAREQ